MKTIKNYCEIDLNTDVLLKKNKKNVFEGAKINKIIINMGVKDANINANKILPPAALPQPSFSK